MSKTVYIFNTTIATTPGLTYHTKVITAGEAQNILNQGPVISAIGHEATASIASAVLGRTIEVNRIQAMMQDGDRAVCIKLKGRPPEGAILSRDEVERIGYELVLMTAVDPRHTTEVVRRSHIYMEWLALPEDAGEGEQPPGTRRRRKDWPVQADFIIRLSDGSYHRLTQDWGTDMWRDQPVTWPAQGERVSCCFEHNQHEGVVERGFEWYQRTGERPPGNLERLGVVIDGVPGWHPIDRVCTPNAATLVTTLGVASPAPAKAAQVDVAEVFPGNDFCR